MKLHVHVAALILLFHELSLFLLHFLSPSLPLSLPSFLPRSLLLPSLPFLPPFLPTLFLPPSLPPSFLPSLLASLPHSPRLQNLPYSLTSLENLTAVWIAENQNRPLLDLQLSRDQGGEKVLTCILLPQHGTEPPFEEPCEREGGREGGRRGGRRGRRREGRREGGREREEVGREGRGEG